MNIKTEPVFPTSNEIYGGLTKREIFAMHAMGSLIANNEFYRWNNNGEIAKEAAEIAGATLEYLEKSQ